MSQNGFYIFKDFLKINVCVCMIICDPQSLKYLFWPFTGSLLTPTLKQRAGISITDCTFRYKKHVT